MAQIDAVSDCWTNIMVQSVIFSDCWTNIMVQSVIFSDCWTNWMVQSVTNYGWRLLQSQWLVVNDLLIAYICKTVHQPSVSTAGCPSQDAFPAVWNGVLLCEMSLDKPSFPTIYLMWPACSGESIFGLWGEYTKMLASIKLWHHSVWIYDIFKIISPSPFSDQWIMDYSTFLEYVSLFHSLFIVQSEKGFYYLYIKKWLATRKGNVEKEKMRFD